MCDEGNTSFNQAVREIHQMKNDPPQQEGVSTCDHLDLSEQSFGSVSAEAFSALLPEIHHSIAKS